MINTISEQSLIPYSPAMLKHRRQQAGMTQPQFAALIGALPLAVKRYESGFCNPKLGTIATMGSVLNCVFYIEPIKKGND